MSDTRVGWDFGAGNYGPDYTGNVEDQAPPTAGASVAGWSTGSGAGIQPTTVLIGLIGLLVVMKLLGEHTELAPGIQPAHIHIGPYNLIVLTVAATVGIVMFKLVFNRWQVPGITDLLNAV